MYTSSHCAKVGIWGQSHPIEQFRSPLVAPFTGKRLHLQVRKITTRVNTVNGRIYSQDPTIFSW